MAEAPAEILLLRKMHPLVEKAFDGRYGVHRLAGAGAEGEEKNKTKKKKNNNNNGF